MVTPRRPPGGAQERAERTRQVVVDETVRYILDEGFAAPSVRRITERAGLTWGVVQYHFGDLDGLLIAGPGFIITPQSQQRVSQIVVRLAIVGLLPQGLVERFKGLAISPGA